RFRRRYRRQPGLLRRPLHDRREPRGVPDHQPLISFLDKLPPPRQPLAPRRVLVPQPQLPRQLHPVDAQRAPPRRHHPPPVPAACVATSAFRARPACTATAGTPSRVSTSASTGSPATSTHSRGSLPAYPAIALNATSAGAPTDQRTVRPFSPTSPTGVPIRS